MTRCHVCESEQRASARFCDQCGAPLSSAGVPTSPLTSAGVPTSPLARAPSEWASMRDYAVRLVSWSLDALEGQPELQSVCIEVEYRNASGRPLRYGLSQWTLYDTSGYAYAFELINQLYQGRALQK